MKEKTKIYNFLVNILERFCSLALFRGELMQIISHEKRSSKLMACEKLCSTEGEGEGGGR
jgi:hypothetical protein